MTTELAPCALYRGTMRHWVGHNKYIEILHILLHLIFIYLILQINKDTLLDLQQNSYFSCTVCATTDSKRRQSQTHIPRFYSYCLELKMFFCFHFRETFIQKNFNNIYYQILSGLFSMNCS